MASKLYKWIAEGAVNGVASNAQYSATADYRNSVWNIIVFRKAYQSDFSRVLINQGGTADKVNPLLIAFIRPWQKV